MFLTNMRIRWTILNSACSSNLGTAHTFLEPKIWLITQQCSKHPHYLNGRLLFLVLTQLFTAFLFVFRGALTDRFVYRWGTVVRLGIPFAHHDY